MPGKFLDRRQQGKPDGAVADMNSLASQAMQRNHLAKKIAAGGELKVRCAFVALDGTGYVAPAYF